MNYALNPDAPEFHPLLTDAVQDGLMRMKKTICTSNCFPRGASFDIYKTYTDFGKVTCKISENVVIQSNQIVVAELPQVKLKSDVKLNDDNNTDKIINVNDSLLDRININIDSLTGVNQPSEQFLQGMGANVSPWNKAPIISRIKVGDTLFIGAKNLPRPQLTFKDPVDNSCSLWVPKLFEKPNSLKPLALSIIYDNNKQAIGYEHPYSLELDMYIPPLDRILPAQQPEFPRELNDTPLTLIDTESALDVLIEHLRTCTEIAVDLEHHAYRSYLGITCLIQITTDAGGDFIIDTLAIRQFIYKLNEIFTDPKIVKVFHGASSDVLWLQRDFGVYVVGLFDTFHAGRALKISSLTLKNLLAIYCKIDIDKKYQLADWRIRPLPAEMIEYARVDTHYLLYVYRMMKLQLMERVGMVPTLLRGVFEKSRHTSYLTFNKPVMDEECHMDLYKFSKRTFNSQQLGALRVLYIWRDQHAREQDESPSYLIPNHMLLNLAEQLPRDLQGMNACCTPMPPFVKIHLVAMHRMILSCRELPPEPVLYEMPPAIRTMLSTNQHLTYHVHDLAYYPEATEHDIDLEEAWSILNEEHELRGVRIDTRPEVVAFNRLPAAGETGESAEALEQANRALKSKLNVDAKMFIPPYDRYRCYRSIVRVEEIKDFKEKEARVTALSQGNELIKTEVLIKLQAQRDAVEASGVTTDPEEPPVQQDLPVQQEPQPQQEAPVQQEETSVETKADKEKVNKAKKIKKVRHQVEKPAAIQPADDKKKEPQKSEPEERDVIKSFHYKNVNYKKFFSDDKVQKQTKTKFKKS